MKRLDWKPLALALAIWASAPVTAQAQCSAPNLTVNNATCLQGQDCVVSINLDTNGGDYAGAGAKLSISSGSIAWSACAPGSAAGDATAGVSCTINTEPTSPGYGKWNVIDLVFPLTPFSDGEVALITGQCDTLGMASLDLSEVSLGKPDGTPQASCGISGTLSCVECLTDGDCSNGLFCDGVETCDASGTCQPGTAPDCDDAIGCTEDSCNEATDSCDNAPDDALCDDAAFCNGTEICHPTLDCLSGAPPDCDNGLFCDGVEVCNETTDTCDSPGRSCDNGMYCDGVEVCNETTDTCDSPGRSCDNGLFCDGVEVCNETTDSCDSPGRSCDNGMYCDGVEVCNETTDTCDSPGRSCDDGVDCTADSCNETTDLCDNMPTNTACDNGTFCDGVEICDAINGCQLGVDPCPGILCDEALDRCANCLSDANCDNSVFCDGIETCDADAICQPGPPLDCDDGVGCTIDRCNETADQCENATNDASCNDGAFCNGVETCDPLADCQPGTPPSVDDGVACTDDSCDESGGTIVHTPNDANCDDGMFCNGAETCDPASDCQLGPSPCVDEVACTVDACDETADECSHVPSDAQCDNGEFCDGAEICDPTTGCVIGAGPCVDGVACTVDACDEAGDRCSHVPSDAQCDDGVTCNGSETCDATAGCIGDTPLDCSELDDECAFGVCSDENGGCEQLPLDDGTSCEDGNACTVGGTLDGGAAALPNTTGGDPNAETCLVGECPRVTFCGVPVSRGDTPLVSDALFALRASVDLETCPPCECDVNADESTSVTDALTILQRTVDLPVELACFVPVASQTDEIAAAAD